MPSKGLVITGASGNVGTALLRRLAVGGADYDIVGIARRQPPPDGFLSVSRSTEPARC